MCFRNVQGVVRKLFLPGTDDEHVLYAAMEEDRNGLVNHNRLKRLDAAFLYMLKHVVRQKYHNGRRLGVKGSEPMRQLQRSYEREKKNLRCNNLSGQEVSANKSTTIRMKRYQDNAELKSQFLNQLKNAYAVIQVEAETRKPLVTKKSPYVVFFDAGSGLSLFCGDIFAAGVNMEYRNVFHSLMKEMRKQRRVWRSRMENHWLSKSEITNRLHSLDSAALQLEMVSTMEKEGKNGLIEASLTDQAERRRNRGRESTKQMRARSCIWKNPTPYIPMSHSQYSILKKLYTYDIWETKLVRTVLSISDRVNLLKGLQERLPPRTETVVHTEMTDMMCEKTARKVENKVKGTGMSDREILVSIMTISKVDEGVIS